MDVDFVRKAVRSIGRLAIKIQPAADQCISVLLKLLQTKISYVVQEAIVVIKDIFRRYPNQYESIIGALCENLDALDEPEAKAAMIWIIGQYADRIENSDELLEDFLFTFTEEPTEVRRSNHLHMPLSYANAIMNDKTGATRLTDCNRQAFHSPSYCRTGTGA